MGLTRGLAEQELSKVLLNAQAHKAKSELAPEGTGHPCSYYKAKARGAGPSVLHGKVSGLGQ